MVGFEKYRTILEGKLAAIDKILGKHKYMAGDVSAQWCLFAISPLTYDVLVSYSG